ncbi:mannonate dehydratase [Alicyclobacillus sendaiensis]|uniref:Mannonate dehydratase n=1 Tax=Alicyclobacillus sendaiensis PA2 TaxID=3029425 RepID=A0ABT6Y1B1_ALISE|nr:mannonate dehydratase [Alicyclobacillus sendaiensis]MDI9261000.1 mannonate dehydratase [Alicyclobacillus sendaiensis PA2]
MQLSFRWYGPDDPVTLAKIRQIPGCVGIVSALYHVPPGEVWPEDEIRELVRRVESHGFRLTVIESVPVHEDIKLGRPTREKYIEAYQETLRRLARAGIDTVCYNFMPLFDWMRTSLAYPLPDGSNSLAYFHDEVDEEALLSGRVKLPVWNIDEDGEKLRRLRDEYRERGDEGLWDSLAYFLRAVAPVAEEVGIRLAIHPDDPPWPILGIPRIIGRHASFVRMFEICDSPANGVCFCSGSLGASAENDLPAILRDLGARNRLHFVHLRNVKRVGEKSFYESGHLSRDGSVDMAELVAILARLDYRGPARPDHGRMIWGETGIPGYGLYDRALGLTYLNGLWEASRAFVADRV